jgi:hypothetical protein
MIVSKRQGLECGNLKVEIEGGNKTRQGKNDDCAQHSVLNFQRTICVSSEQEGWQLLNDLE